MSPGGAPALGWGFVMSIRFRPGGPQILASARVLGIGAAPSSGGGRTA